MQANRPKEKFSFEEVLIELLSLRCISQEDSGLLWDLFQRETEDVFLTVDTLPEHEFQDLQKFLNLEQSSSYILMKFEIPRRKASWLSISQTSLELILFGLEYDTVTYVADV